MLVLVSSLLTCVSVAVGVSSGSFDVDELRFISYDLEFDKTPLGLDPKVDLSKQRIRTGDEKSLIVNAIPEESDPSYMVMVTKSGARVACEYPKKDGEKDDGVDEEQRSDNPAYVREIAAAAFYIHQCVSKNTGWWTYEVCLGKTSSQLHYASPKAKDPETTVSLGVHMGNTSVHQSDGRKTSAYLQETFEGGTMCEIGDQRQRRTVVRYSCDPALETSDAYVDTVDETATCEYLVDVKVGSLCKLASFLPPQRRVKMTCRPYLDREKLLEHIKNKATVVSEKLELDDDWRARERELKWRPLSIQRQRNIMRRVTLQRDWDQAWVKERQADLKRKFDAALKEYLVWHYQEKRGVPANSVALAAITRLLPMMDVPEEYSKVFTSYSDEDRANVYYYFTDPHWDKRWWPMGLDDVDALNEYWDRALALYDTAETDEEANALLDLAEGHPTEWGRNVLVDRENLRHVLLAGQPSWLPRNETTGSAQMVRHLAVRQRETVELWQDQLRKFASWDDEKGLIEWPTSVAEEDRVKRAVEQVTRIVAPAQLYFSSPDLELEKMWRATKIEMVDRMQMAWEMNMALHSAEWRAQVARERVKVAQQKGMTVEKYYLLHSVGSPSRTRAHNSQLWTSIEKQLNRSLDAYLRRSYARLWKEMRIPLRDQRRKNIKIHGLSTYLMPAPRLQMMEDSESLLKLTELAGVSDMIEVKVQSIDEKGNAKDLPKEVVEAVMGGHYESKKHLVREIVYKGV